MQRVRLPSSHVGWTRLPGSWFRVRTLMCGEEFQVAPVADAVPRWLTAVAGDEPGPRRAVEVGVPGPGQVARVPEVQPPHQRADVAVRAVVLAHLPGDDRHLVNDRQYLAGPARLVGA